MRADIPRFLDDLLTWTTFDIAWAQRYAVTTYCRMLYTLQTGRVTWKDDALRWARERVDTQWQPLIDQVREDRSLSFDAEERPRRGSLDRTPQFSRYVERLVRAEPQRPLA